MAAVHLSDGNDDGTTIGQSVTDKVSLYGVTPVIQALGADQAECPAGGTGAAAGGWDTADHRDEAIALINEMRTALINFGIIKGSA